MGRTYRTAQRAFARKPMLCRLPAHQSEHRPAWEKAGYAAQLDRDLPDEICCAKLGFAVKAGTLPINPLHTASAARPLPFRRPTWVRKSAEMPEAARMQPVPQSQAPITPDVPAAFLQNHAGRSTDNATGNKPLSLLRNKRMNRLSMPFQPSVFAGLFPAIMAIALGAFWWLGNMGNPTLAGAVPSSAKAQSSEARTSAYPAPKTPSEQHGYQATTATATQAGSGKDRNDSKEIRRQAEPSQSLPVSDLQPGAVVDSLGSSAVEPRPAIADSTSEDSKEHPSEKQNRRAPQPTVTANEKDRSKDSSRLRAKASSEARKGRVTLAKASTKPSPKRQVMQASSKRRPGNTNLLTQKTSMGNEFQQCKSKPSFLQREKCKWKICAGNWGKDGCPAYNHDVARY